MLSVDQFDIITPLVRFIVVSVSRISHLLFECLLFMFIIRTLFPVAIFLDSLQLFDSLLVEELLLVAPGSRE